MITAFAAIGASIIILTVCAGAAIAAGIYIAEQISKRW